MVQSDQVHRKGVRANRVMIRKGKSDCGLRPVISRSMIELLEARLVLSTFLVTNTNDSGPGTLRQAVLDANVDEHDDTIFFDANGVFANPQTIYLQSTLVISPTSGALEIIGT